MKPALTLTKNVIRFEGGLCDFSIPMSQITLGDVDAGWITLETTPPISLRLTLEKFDELKALLPSPSPASSQLELFTDGSASPNPGRGGWGAVLYQGQKEVKAISGGHPHTGNGKMELMGVIKGLALIPLGAEAQVWIDAQYVVNTIGEGLMKKVSHGWLTGWKKKGWVKADGEEPKNLTELKTLDLALRRHIEGGSQLTFSWTKGHAGTKGNERADELANIGREGTK